MAILIERKEFFVEWTGVEGRSLVVFTERTKKRIVRGFLSKECVLWLSQTFRKFASEWESSSEVEGAASKVKR